MLFHLNVTHKVGPASQAISFARVMLCTLIALFHLSTEAYAVGAASQRVTSSLYGKAGIIEMPNALFFDPGHIALTGMLKDPDNRVTLNFQPVPWFEGSFRYAIVENDFPGGGPDPDRFDRSFDLKLRLTGQRRFLPAIAVGIQDIIGTGIYSSEFVVATYSTQQFNFTMGVGFGRFASRGNLTNPLALAFDSFETRQYHGGISGTGQVFLGRFFAGEDMGVFGGIEYLTPVNGLKFMAEYSSDAYSREEERNIADADFPMNFGATYRMGENMEIGASLIHGDTFALRFTMQTNPITQRDPPRLDPPRFRFQTRGDDPAPDVKPFAGESDLYRQYSDLQNKVYETTTPKKKREYLSAENVWNPWKNQIPKARRTGDTGYPKPEREIAVPKTVDFEWIEFAQKSNAAVKNADFSTSNNSSSHWHSADWTDEAVDNQQSDYALHQRDNINLAQNAAPTDKDRAALVSARSKTWSWPLTGDDKQAIAESIRRAASVQKIAIVAVDFDDTNLKVYYYNGKYHFEAEAIGRLLAILTQAAPSRIEIFSLVAVINDLQVSEIQVPRRSLERIVSNYGSPQELFNVTTFSEGPTSRPADLQLARGWLPTIDYRLSPSLRYSLFDPEDPMRYQISALLAGTTQLYDGLSISAIYRLNIYDNFDEITRISNSKLPHVRSDFAKYLNMSDHSLEMLSLNYAWQPARNWYARSFAGYFEEMYAGVGGEALYRPYGKRWALALEVDYVRQRDFDRGFGLRDYKTVTGFAKWYYEVPYEDLRVELNVGRYLAEDIGATFKVSRTFDNGTEIGAFATLTDVPFRTFGEGSFDKGIVIKIPFHLFSFFDTKQVYSTVIKPLTRDGGAQVWSGAPLYDTVQQFSLGNIRRNWEAVFEK